jgi:hypothetical protein
MIQIMLCIEQRRAGTFNGNQMSVEGYKAIMDGLVARRGLARAVNIYATCSTYLNLYMRCDIEVLMC